MSKPIFASEPTPEPATVIAQASRSPSRPIEPPAPTRAGALKAALFGRARDLHGKVIFAREKWFQRILHNETATAIQKRLGWARRW